MSSIPESHRDLLERPIIASLATVQPDGQPPSATIIDGTVVISSRTMMRGLVSATYDRMVSIQL